MSNIKDIILSTLSENKAENLVSFDLKGKSSLCDGIFLSTGSSLRHIKALSEYVLKALKDAGIKGIHVEGLKECDWILIDTGDYIIHLFTEEVREFYNLESLWEDLAPKLTHE